jgi:hypothetical protein
MNNVVVASESVIRNLIHVASRKHAIRHVLTSLDDVISQCIDVPLRRWPDNLSICADVQTAGLTEPHVVGPRHERSCKNGHVMLPWQHAEADE